MVQNQIQKVAIDEQQGGGEYWLGHPSDRLVAVRLLGADGKYGLPAIQEAKVLLPL